MDNDRIQCPLCDGASKVSRAQLIRVLRDPSLRNKVEALLAESGTAPHAAIVTVGAPDFQTQVHSWNPANPMWKRSPKE